ncbi:hypothetical protein Taro_040729 [Colocasia esculenta]|uniref:Uncharacterized protein n=1 Tax=Colocasia esculenta TaxID=4460 RepID=A0A843WJJ0_COLES|nr:hypothetical protein [Colocasia esculenta]
MPIGSLFGFLDPRVVCFDPLDSGFFLDPSFQRPTQSRNPNRIPSVRTRHFHPSGRVGANCTSIRSLFGILDPRVVCFDPLDSDPSFQRPTQSGNPNQIPSVRTHHFNPPGRVGPNGTPIGYLFGILDPGL